MNKARCVIVTCVFVETSGELLPPQAPTAVDEYGTISCNLLTVLLPDWRLTPLREMAPALDESPLTIARSLYTLTGVLPLPLSASGHPGAMWTTVLGAEDVRPLM